MLRPIMSIFLSMIISWISSSTDCLFILCCPSKKRSPGRYLPAPSNQLSVDGLFFQEIESVRRILPQGLVSEESPVVLLGCGIPKISAPFIVQACDWCYHNWKDVNDIS
ncbi:hypothetical protein L218DRAFT_991802 [Marasmius fiardii PR-910]|nr:hypothetical protein L218DRAFT_991802 [Marasmius fiardii PR-910]